MAKEEKLFSVTTELTDKDFEEVYKIYLEAERRNRYVPLIVSIVLGIVCIVLMFTLHNFMMIFYAIACVAVGLSYCFIPANKKFLATNRLQYGEKREMTFYPHEVTSFELIDDEEELSEEERENALTHFSTSTMKAFESKQGFVFADGAIANNFLYVPKKGTDDEIVAMLIDFAKNRCSGGYMLLATQSLLNEDEVIDIDDSGENVSAEGVCEQYYGAKKLRIFDDNGNRIHDFDEDAEENEDMTESADETLETEESFDESEPETEA